MNDKIDYGKFDNIMSQFIPDLLETFPEYTPLVNKWWKNEDNFNDIEDIEERKKVYAHEHKKCLKFIHKYSTSKLTPHTLLILQKDESLFTDTSIDTEFLPYLHFRNLWALEVSDATRNKLWNYLRLILLSIIGCDDSENNNENLQEQINSVLEEFLNMNDDLNTNDNSNDGNNNNENSGAKNDDCGNSDSFQNMMSDLLDSKLGSIAKEFSSDFASSLNLDTSNPDSVKESLGNLMKDPSKLMSMAGNISEKLTDKINNGELDESELMSESSKMLEKLSGLKGTKDINQLFKSMGMGDLMGNLGGAGSGAGGKVNVGAMAAKLKQQVATEQMKQRMKAKLNKKKASAAENENKVFTEEDERKRQQCENELLEMIGESNVTNKNTKNTKTNKQLAKKNKNKKG
ncbi:hypothetical protein N8459_02790 [Nitrosopumilus sp.]|nr:hypothetical protein [Nitrosopumilus sp.]